MRGCFRALLAVALAAGALSSTSCGESCLGGENGCRVASPCARLSYQCASGVLDVHTLTTADKPPQGLNAMAAAGDVILGNGEVTAVIAAIGNQNYLDPNGGALLDLTNVERNNDGINQILQVVGVLPRDSAHYTRLEIIDERPTRVAVQVRGTLHEFPDTPIVTLYEIRPCEPGIRIRTEIVNGTPDTQMWALSDGYYWSLREPIPFTPIEGAGFNHPSFGLTTIDDAYVSSPFMAASTHTEPRASYAVVGCNTEQVEGFHSQTVSSAGLTRRVVPPRGYLVFERFVTVAPTGDVAGAIDQAWEARRQLYGDQTVVVRGKVERGALRSTGEREFSVLISEGEPATLKQRCVPWTQVVPDDTGAFAARVPAGKKYVAEVFSLGVKVGEKAFTVDKSEVDLGSIGGRPSNRLTVTVKDGKAGRRIAAEVFVVPVDQTTREASKGTFHNQYGECAPWLGIPSGPSPACNRFLVAGEGEGPAQVDAPPGKFHLYAFHGPFWTIDRKTVDLAGDGSEQKLEFTLQPLDLQPPGTVSADLHVHGAVSFDSQIPEYDRVLSFAAVGVDVIISTDHENIHDYSPLIRQLGLDAKMSAVVGVETTGHIPFMRVPGDPFPRVIGHYNFWPLKYLPGTPRNGGPFDEFVEPGELFDRVEPLFTGLSVIQLNHPWAPVEFGRDLGFPRALGLNLYEAPPSVDNGTPAGMYVRAPAGKHRNNDHHAQEVMNGTQNDVLLQYRSFWFYSLSVGQLRTGTANSDSHGLTDNTIGSPRNLVWAKTSPGNGFDVDIFNQAVRDGAVSGTNGPVIEATMTDADGVDRPFGLGLLKPGAASVLKIEVSAAPWVPVDQVRIIVNGKVAQVLDGADVSKPDDPLGTGGLLRCRKEVPLAGLLPDKGDAWIVIEAGVGLPVAADLGGGKVTEAAPHGELDGIPDTTDNNGDGKIDEKDIDPEETVGPLKNIAWPKDEADPRFHFAQVVDNGYPFAFTNPFVVDVNGNGVFDAPGVYRPSQGSK